MKSPRHVPRNFAPKVSYTSGDVAVLLGVCPGTVNRAMDRGAIPCYRVPGSRARRISPEQLDAFLADQPQFQFARERLHAAERASAQSQAQQRPEEAA